MSNILPKTYFLLIVVIMQKLCLKIHAGKERKNLSEIIITMFTFYMFKQLGPVEPKIPSKCNVCLHVVVAL